MKKSIVKVGEDEAVVFECDFKNGETIKQSIDDYFDHLFCNDEEEEEDNKE